MSLPIGVTPAINREEEPFWAFASDGLLMVPQCDTCGRHTFPPRSFCSACSSSALTWVEVTMPGVVYSFTTNYNSWDGSEVPYSLVVVDLSHASDIRMIGLYEGPDEPTIGQQVDVKFEPGPGGLTRPVFTAWETV